MLECILNAKSYQGLMCRWVRWDSLIAISDDRIVALQSLVWEKATKTIFFILRDFSQFKLSRDRRDGICWQPPMRGILVASLQLKPMLAGGHNSSFFHHLEET